MRHKEMIAKCVELSVHIDDEGWSPPDDLLDDFQKRRDRESGAAELLVVVATGEPITVQQLVDFGVARMDPLPVGLHRRKFELTLQPKTYALAKRDPFAYVEALVVALDVHVTEKTIQDIRLHQYAKGKDIQLELATVKIATARFGALQFQMAFTRRQASE